MFTKPEFQVGDTLTIQKMITTNDTLMSFGNGGLDNLLATPSLIAMIIEASSRLLDRRLQSDYVTAGTQISVKHLNPSPIGNTVTVKVTIHEIVGNHIHLDIEATDEMGLIATGTHERAIVNKNGIKAKALSRSL